MRVLLTRPLEDSQRSADKLAQRGYEPVVAPLLAINYIDGEEPPLEGVQAVLVTSSNGVRGFARRTGRRDIPLFAVGSHTAAVAAQEGFALIRDAQGDAAALAEQVCAQLHPGAGALLHAAGTNASPALSAQLTRAGFEIRACVVYEVAEAAELPYAAADALRLNRLDAILIYSPRSARLFADRVKRANLAPSCRRLVACCISSEAATALDGLSFTGIRIAGHPDQERLFELLGTTPPRDSIEGNKS
jgi:uroporphyrinogen-III synthase